MILLVGVSPVASFAAHLAMLRAILPRGETLAIGAAFPAVFISGTGATASDRALLGSVVHLLDHRRWLAGMLIGLLAYRRSFRCCRAGSPQPPAFRSG